MHSSKIDTLFMFMLIYFSINLFTTYGNSYINNSERNTTNVEYYIYTRLKRKFLNKRIIYSNKTQYIKNIKKQNLKCLTLHIILCRVKYDLQINRASHISS